MLPFEFRPTALGPLSVGHVGRRHLAHTLYHWIRPPNAADLIRRKSELDSERRTNLLDCRSIAELILSRFLRVFLYFCALVPEYLGRLVRRHRRLADDCLAGNSAIIHTRSPINN